MKTSPVKISTRMIRQSPNALPPCLLPQTTWQALPVQQRRLLILIPVCLRYNIALSNIFSKSIIVFAMRAMMGSVFAVYNRNNPTFLNSLLIISKH